MAVNIPIPSHSHPQFPVLFPFPWDSHGIPIPIGNPIPMHISSENTRPSPSTALGLLSPAARRTFSVEIARMSAVHGVRSIGVRRVCLCVVQVQSAASHPALQQFAEQTYSRPGRTMLHIGRRFVSAQNDCADHRTSSRDVREWFSVFPIPPIPARSFPFPFAKFTHLKNHSHSRIAPSNSFPFPPIPIPASPFRLIVGCN